MAMSGVWSWKVEPASPLFQLEADSWLGTSDNVAVEVELTDDIKARAEHASKLLQDLDQWNKEEEPFPDWLEEKIDLPIFEDLPPPPLVNSLDMISPGLKPSVNSNLDMVAMKTPQIGLPSPLDEGGIEVVAMKPHNHSQLVNLSPIQYQQTNLQMEQQGQVLMQELLQDYPLPPATAPAAADTLTPPDSPRDADLVFTMLQEMQPHELDELVRMRVESLVESPESRCDSESVASPSASDSCYSDPEWTMASTSDVKLPKRRRVSKPYSRTPPEEKKLRKKEQNKNAATRYRLKKKQEIEEILGEEKQLQQTNEQLRTELTELGREIKYLKNLMRDLFKAKGLIK